MKSNEKAEDQTFRWSVIQRDTFKSNPQDEVISRTNSAKEAETAFKSKHDTRVIDHINGDMVAYTDWIRDGSSPDWHVSPQLTAFVAMEEKGIAWPVQSAELSGPDREVAERLITLENNKERQGAQERQLSMSLKEAFGDKLPGIRAGELPKEWNGEAQARPVIVEGSYEAGTLQDRDPRPGEQPHEWRVLVNDQAGKTHWFANAYDQAEAKDLATRLNQIGIAIKEPHEINKAYEAGRDKLREIGEKTHGENVRMSFPETGEKYTGKVVAVTEKFTVQGLKDKPDHLIAHERQALSGKEPKTGSTVEISYPYGRAGLVRETTHDVKREHSAELQKQQSLERDR